MPIVAATFAAANARDKGLAKRLEAAMANAIQSARDEGIVDLTIIKERMMDAYRKEKGQ